MGRHCLQEISVAYGSLNLEVEIPLIIIRILSSLSPLSEHCKVVCTLFLAKSLLSPRFTKSYSPPSPLLCKESLQSKIIETPGHNIVCFMQATVQLCSYLNSVHKLTHLKDKRPSEFDQLQQQVKTKKLV